MKRSTNSNRQKLLHLIKVANSQNEQHESLNVDDILKAAHGARFAATNTPALWEAVKKIIRSDEGRLHEPLPREKWGAEIIQAASKDRFLYVV